MCNDGIATANTVSADVAAYVGVDGVTPIQEQLSYHLEIDSTEHFSAGIFCDPEIENGPSRTIKIKTLSGGNSQIGHLPEDCLTTIARPICDKTLDDDIRELQHATATFLADKYDNGQFIATTKDIADLEEATSGVLRNQHAGQRFVSENCCLGLLLPGEHFLLPALMAVHLARFSYDSTENIFETIDDCLHAEMNCEHESNSPLWDTASVGRKMTKVECALSDDHLGLDASLETPLHDEQFDTRPFWGLTCIAPGLLKDDPDSVGQHFLTLAYSKHIEDHSDKQDHKTLSNHMTDITDMAFDAPDAVSLSQASYAASFFDPNTESLVVYTSLDQLLALSEDEGFVPRVYQAHDADDVSDREEYVNCGVAEISWEIGDGSRGNYVQSNEFCIGWNMSEVPSATKSARHRTLQTDRQLSTILEEDEPHSAVRYTSLTFPKESWLVEKGSLPQDLHGVNKGLTVLPVKRVTSTATTSVNILAPDQRRLDVGTKATGEVLGDWLMQPASSCIMSVNRAGAECFEQFFANDVWTNEPDLELTAPYEEGFSTGNTYEAGLEVSEVLTAVFEVVRLQTWGDVPSFAADLKQRLHSNMPGPSDRSRAERLGKATDLGINHVGELNRSDFECL